MKVKLCVFDLDGTVLDTLDDIKNSCNESLEKLGLYSGYSLDDIKKYIGEGRSNLLKGILPNEYKDDKEIYKKLEDIYFEVYSKNLDVTTKVFDGIEDMLKKLKSMGIKLAILTNKQHENAVKIIDKYFGENLFDIVYGVITQGIRKPNPKYLNVIMEKAGVLPENTMFIGDSDVDIFTGKNGQTGTIGVAWGYRTVEELIENKADFIAYKPENIVEYIKNIK